MSVDAQIQDLHILYAVLETVHGLHRVKLSEPLDWHAAVDRHDALHRDAWGRYDRPVVRPGYSVYGRPVAHLAVRSATDPAWPSDRATLSLTDDRTGTRCTF